MAQYRFSSQIIGRRTGRSAVAAAAYRAGASLADERTGEVHDFSRRGGVLHTEIMAPDLAPDWMRDRQRLWNAVEIAERRGDAQLSREVQLSLPHELTDEQRLALVREFVGSQFVARGMIADVAIHAPGREGDDRNHHAHIMLTMRELTGEGFGNKARGWNSPELLQEWREEWANQQNRALERYGHPTRVDHLSLEVQGIDREPQRHLGAHAHQMEQQGKPSRIGDENRAIDTRNADRAATYQAGVVVNLAIERHRRDSAAHQEQRLAALSDAFKLADIDIDRRFDRQLEALKEQQESQYGAHGRAMTAELSAIDGRARSTGWRGVMRKVTGAESRDLRRADELRRTLANVELRKQEQLGALRYAQRAERSRIAADRAGQTEKLRADMARKAQAREKEILAQQRREAWKAKRTADRATRKDTPPRQRPALSEEQQAKGIGRKQRLAQHRGREAKENPIVKDAFNKAREIEAKKTPRIAPQKTVAHSTPAPAPSPTGGPPRAARAPQQVPKVDKVKEWAKTQEGQRMTAKTAAPSARRDMDAVSKPKAPAATKAWAKAAAPAQPAPSPAPQQQSAPRKDWAAAATPSERKATPVKRPARDTDRAPDKER
jgi:hypothetical protein